MVDKTLETWFWNFCDELEAQPAADMTELELEALEFRDLRARAGGEGSVAYYTDSPGITPSRIVALLAKFAPPHVAAASRYLSRLCPDDAPFDPNERGYYLEDRLSRTVELGIQAGYPEEIDAAAVLDEYCMGPEIEALYAHIKRQYPSQ
jgi:hypothetical protein